VKVLLDTCTFLWITLGSPELSATAKEVFANPDNDVYFSATSAWEIGVKYSLGRLRLPEEPARFIPKQREAHGIEPLALTEEAALHVVRLPTLDRDPFDRMLVAQALVEGLVILTPDTAIAQYPARVIW